jgi:hypothetical protein
VLVWFRVLLPRHRPNTWERREGDHLIYPRGRHMFRVRHSACLQIYPPVPNFQKAPRARRRIDSLFVSLPDPCTVSFLRIPPLTSSYIATRNFESGPQSGKLTASASGAPRLRCIPSLSGIFSCLAAPASGRLKGDHPPFARSL